MAKYSFTDLIAQSYIEYTKEKEDNIAHFYFQEHYQVRPSSDSNIIYTKEQFFKKLIREIDKLISSTVYNRHIDKSLYNYDTQINEGECFKIWEEKRVRDHQLLLDDHGVNITIKRKDWETNANAKELNEALNEGLSIKDPVKIISFSNEIDSGDLVLRKSKLEFLKKEAIRASNAEIMDELREFTLPISDSQKEGENNEIKKVVKKAFNFTLSKDPRKKKQILSLQDYERLVSWVSSYYENDLKLPEVKEPIETVNTSRGNIRSAFKDLFVLLHPTKIKPDSFFELISLCFLPYLKDKKINIEKTKKPDGYDGLVAKSN